MMLFVSPQDGHSPDKSSKSCKSKTLPKTQWTRVLSAFNKVTDKAGTS